ncbi:MAG TPA: hypothetical protein VEK38_01605 [Candidatus Bathyarchaeia archaeon]|nr:hypothetical protein [Candidatus Bathyarchaeia archaeon]
MYTVRPFTRAALGSLFFLTSVTAVHATTTQEQFGVIIDFVRAVNIGFINVLARGSHAGFSQITNLVLPSEKITRQGVIDGAKNAELVQELQNVCDRLEKTFVPIKKIFGQFMSAGPDKAANMVSALKQSCGGNLRTLFDEFIKAIAHIRTLAIKAHDTDLINVIDTFTKELAQVKEFWDKQKDPQLLTKLVRAMKTK